MADAKNIGGRFYPPFHAGWGGFAEELFHYTSRYYCTTEAFLRNLVSDREFTMSGYKAADLSPDQRELLALVLAGAPGEERATAVVAIVEAVKRGEADVAPQLAERFRQDAPVPDKTLVEHHQTNAGLPDVEPFDPFLNLAERLLMPVAVRDRHVEVSLQQLAYHLDSANSALRTNLRNAVIQLHEAGFVLRNHPHLTHAEAHDISDGDAV